jgi:hypothetical protein
MLGSRKCKSEIEVRRVTTLIMIAITDSPPHVVKLKYHGYDITAQCNTKKI